MDQRVEAGSGGAWAVTRLSAMMFLQFFVWGAWYVSQTGFMNARGMGGPEGLIGWTYTVGPIAAVLSPLFIGLVADRYFSSERLLAVLHVAGAGFMLAAPFAARPYHGEGLGLLEPYVLLLLGHMLCYMPTLSLTASLAMRHLSDAPRQFPVVRVWGTLGWIVANILVGGNLRPWGLNVEWVAGGDTSPVQFYLAGGVGIALGLYALTLPRTPPVSRGTRPSVGELLGADAWRLMRRPAFAVFVVCSFLLCIPLAGYYGFARNFVDSRGFGNAPLVMSYGQMSELGFMVLMPLMFRRLGIKWMLAAGMLGWTIRYGLFAGAEVLGWNGLVVVGILLHGVCYDFFFVAGSVYADRAAAPGARGQAQGVFVLVTQGLGLGAGAQAFQWMIGRLTSPGGGVDWVRAWLYPAGLALAVFLVFAFAFRENSGKEKG